MVAQGGKVAIDPSSSPSVQCDDKKRPDLFDKRALNRALMGNEKHDLLLKKLVEEEEKKRAAKKAKERASGSPSELADDFEKAAERSEQWADSVQEHVTGGLAGERPPAGSTPEGVAKQGIQKSINEILKQVLPAGVGGEVDLKGGAKGSIDPLKLYRYVKKKIEHHEKQVAEKAPQP